MTSESLLFIVVRVSAFLAAWVGTYAIHSTLLLTAVCLLNARFVQSHAGRELLWKTALVAGVLTASVQTLPVVQPVFGRYDVSAVIEKKIARDLPLSQPALTTPSMQIFRARLPDVSETLRFIPIMLVLLWSAYAVAVLCRVLFATRRARAKLGPRTNASDAGLDQIFRQVLLSFGIRKPVRLTISGQVASPVVLGGSEVCIPDQLPTELTREEQKSVLAHEVAHLARRDPAWLLAAVTIESILFFQPLNVVARRRIQEEAEYLADGLAVTKVGSGVILARCLARVAEWMAGKHQPLMAPALMEQEHSLVGRVKSLLEGSSAASRPWASPKHGSLAFALPLFVLLVAPGFTSGGSRGWGKPAFRWEGRVEAGKVIEVKTLMGNVRAVPWSGSTVVVTATRHGRATNPDISFALLPHANGITVCTVYPAPVGMTANSCAPGSSGRDYNTPANDVEIDYLVKVPRGVGFAARTSTGDIVTGPLSAPVAAYTGSGSIDVRTSSHAEAGSGSGNVTLRMGATDWRDTLRIATNSGNIRVYLPADAATAIIARSQVGTVRANFKLTGEVLGFFERLKLRGSLGEHASGSIGDTTLVGAPRRALLLESMAGGINIRRASSGSR